MTNNVEYSAVIRYNDDDIIWYNFVTLDELKNFKELLPDFKLEYEKITYLKFVFNISKCYELNDSLQVIK